jgi:chromosomal replication initiation ATPase DnaA
VTPAQLVLDLPYVQSFDEADFFITSKNEQAFRLITAWPNWPSAVIVLCGPAGSGKTHLAKIWQRRAAARFLDPAGLQTHIWPEGSPPLAIEDVDTAPFCETALFHHLNLAVEHGSSILLTAQTPPGQWALELPDLRSRVRSYAWAELLPPGEEELAALFVKHFTDRQIEVAPGVISYLIARMERSMAAVQALSAVIDKLALSEHRKVTRVLAARAFAELKSGINGVGYFDDGECDL